MRVRTAVSVFVASVAAVTLGATGAVAETSPRNAVQTRNDVKQLDSPCDDNFCGYSSVTNSISPVSCNSGTVVIPSSWRRGNGGGWWMNNTPGFVYMYNSSGRAIYVADPCTADGTADWRPVYSIRVIC